MLEAPQIIDFEYKGRRHWFNVWRYNSDIDLHSALILAGIRPEKDTIAYCDNYPDGEECGAIYLLNTSVDTLAHEATHMALGILARHGNTSLPLTTDEEPELAHDLCHIIGHITAELYSRSRYY